MKRTLTTKRGDGFEKVLASLYAPKNGHLRRWIYLTAFGAPENDNNEEIWDEDEFLLATSLLDLNDPDVIPESVLYGDNDNDI